VPDNSESALADHTQAQLSLSRCWNAHSIRTFKRVIGGILFLNIADAAIASVWNGGAYSKYLTEVGTHVGTGVQKTFTVGGQLANGINNAVYPVISAVNSTFGLPVVTAAWALVAGSFAAVYSIGTIYIAVNAMSFAALAPIITATKAVNVIPEVTVDILAGLVGYGPKYPKCCCPDDKSTISTDGKSRVCALVSSIDISSTPNCPLAWSHVPDQCVVPEVIQYSDKKTMEGCKCKDFTSCGTNSPFRGHAWCLVEKDSCGQANTRFPSLTRGRNWDAADGVLSSEQAWDYCMIDGKPLEYATGVSTTANDALASFIPNEFGGFELWGPGNALRIGTWTDASRGVTTGYSDPSMFAERKCFVSLPAETLGACAQACLDEGAPDADTLSNSTEVTAYPCVAFAYNRALKSCVRLPAFVADAKYTPLLHDWNGDGWQNFVSKFFGASLESSCPAMTLLDIKKQGYDVVRDMNDGHLFLRCGDKETPRASCIQSECEGSGANNKWCFVQQKWNVTSYVYSPIADQEQYACKSK
jgi:hypothetical protein